MHIQIYRVVHRRSWEAALHIGVIVISSGPEPWPLYNVWLLEVIINGGSIYTVHVYVDHPDTRRSFLIKSIWILG